MLNREDRNDDKIHYIDMNCMLFTTVIAITSITFGLLMLFLSCGDPEIDLFCLMYPYRHKGLVVENFLVDQTCYGFPCYNGYSSITYDDKICYNEDFGYIFNKNITSELFLPINSTIYVNGINKDLTCIQLSIDKSRNNAGFESFLLGLSAVLFFCIHYSCLFLLKDPKKEYMSIFGSLIEKLFGLEEYLP